MKLITNLSAIQKNLFFGIGFVLFASLVLLINWFMNLPVKQADVIGNKLAHTTQQIRLTREAMSANSTSQVTSMTREIREDIEFYQSCRFVKHRPQLKKALSEQLSALGTFEGNFEDLMLGNEERGNEHAGLISRWQETSGRLIADSRQNSPEIQHLAENIRRDEMDYLLHGNFSTCENIQATLTELKSKLSEKQAGIKPADLDSYSALTTNLVALDKRMGSSLVAKTNQGLEMLTTLSQSTEKQITDALAKSRVLWRILLYITIALLTISGTIMLILVTNGFIIRPLTGTTSFVARLAEGEIPAKSLQAEGLPEIRQIGAGLNMLVTELQKKTAFVRALNSNNIELTLTPAGPEDILAVELNTMRQQMADAVDKQKINEEDNIRRRYINEGLARFAEILRTQSNEMEKLGDAFIREIVKYLDAIQGGFFLLNEDNDQAKSLDLISSFAYDRKKYLQKKLMPGEGLVGTCAREKQIINLTEVPEGYITITSGLGDTKPDNLLLVPVMHEEEIIGVLEIASLHVYKDHEIEFARQVADSLGSTIIYARNNQRTSALLQKTQQQAQEMSEQEEEMRQNMEELKATQEESGRREEQSRGIAEAINNTMMIVRYDLDGLIREANDKFCIFTGIPRESMLGKTHQEIVEGSLDPDRSFWNQLNQKVSHTADENVKIGKKTHHLKEYFSVILNKDGSVDQYINFITETAG